MISVCIATYNGEKYIKQQLSSILCQISLNDEVIVSDDNSTDRTVEIIQNLDDARIKVLNANFHNVIKNIENALNYAKGDFIFLCDQDDVWLPNKVSICLQALSKSDLVVSDCFITDKDLNIISNSFFKQNNSHKNKWRALLRSPYIGCCMAFRRTILKDALPFPKIPMHDLWIGNVAAFRYKINFIPEKLIYYRRHGSNQSTASESSQSSTFQKITYRTSIIYGLMKIAIQKINYKG